MTVHPAAAYIVFFVCYVSIFFSLSHTFHLSFALALVFALQGPQIAFLCSTNGYKGPHSALRRMMVNASAGSSALGVVAFTLAMMVGEPTIAIGGGIILVLAGLLIGGVGSIVVRSLS